MKSSRTTIAIGSHHRLIDDALLKQWFPEATAAATDREVSQSQKSTTVKFLLATRTQLTLQDTRWRHRVHRTRSHSLLLFHLLLRVVVLVQTPRRARKARASSTRLSGTLCCEAKTIGLVGRNWTRSLSLVFSIQPPNIYSLFYSHSLSTKFGSNPWITTTNQ